MENPAAHVTETSANATRPLRRAQPPTSWGRLRWLVFLGLVAGGLMLRVATVWRPIDDTSTSPWRECDLGMIARNFWRGDMNILYPRIDWRGDGPGLVECELPLLAWLMAAGYRLLGYHEEIGRVLALLISFGSVWAFFVLARALLPPAPASFALLFFLFNPIVVQFATNIQPDPGMLLCSIVCTHAFVRWQRGGRPAALALCALAGALAILLKAPALGLGLVLAPLCLERSGWGALRRPGLWALAAAMLLPGMLWYRHAHGFWLAYGKSLGISNETHWMGLDLLRQPRELVALLINAAWIEAVQVFGVFGLPLAAAGAIRAWRGGQRVAVWWLGAALVFYLAALRTAGDNWAYYYHGLSVAPACLLLGLGMRGGGGLFRMRKAEGGMRIAESNLGRLAGGRGFRFFARLGLHAAGVLALGILGFKAVRAIDLLPPRTGDAILSPRYAAAGPLAERIPPEALVVTIGGPGKDATGQPVAYDDGTFLFFLDRKGFILPREAASVAAVRRLEPRGAKFLVVQRDTPLAAEARRLLRRAAAFGEYELFAIQ